MRAIKFDHATKRIVRTVISAAFAMTLIPFPGQGAMADPIDTIVTSYQPVISESIDANGFKHPGVGFTKAQLENMRAQVLAKKEPWYTHFNMMLTSGTAGRTVGPSNVSSTDPTMPRFLGLDGSAEGAFKADALRAYTQAILYYVTGDQVYRANAMRIIRLYENMDPSKYVYYADSHIHTGIPLQRMAGAAEILRYTSTTDPTLEWTETDTQKFSANFVTPTIQTFNNCNCRFMNQHLYTTIGKMSGSIFMGDREGYEQAVEWFTVNKDAPDPAWTGAIKQLFRLVTENDATGEAIPPQIQHVEMGRDQAHGAGDLTNSEILARMLMAQGTKVDPVTGAPSTESNAVGPYEFLDDRLLAVHELFGKFMIGYEIPWVPVAMSVYPDGSIRAMYPNVSQAYRGRLTQNTWEAYYYYKYVRGIDLEQVAPEYVTMFAKRKAYNWEGVDGGGDFWLAIPKAAEAEGSKYLGIPIVDPYREVEDRFTLLAGASVAQTEGATGFVRSTATPEGTRYAVYSYNGVAVTSIGFRIRTNGQAMMDANGNLLALPNTRGQWRYMVVPMNIPDFLKINISGNGTTVDIDHINVQSSTLLSPPVFKYGSGDATVYTYAGATVATTIDLSATDPAVGDVVTYNMDNLPQGASFNTSTGAFSWKPTQAGTYTFVAEASDGTTVSTKRITVVVGADRQSTVSAVTALFKPDTLYVSSTKGAYQAAYADMQNTIGSSTDASYFQKLATLQGAVSGLKELTPLLPDGSMNYTNLFFKTNLVTNFGDWAANGIDDNTDTFVAYTIARDSARTFTLDFGPGFKASANAFQLETRSSFPERVGGVTIFASNDNENWTRLTPGETQAIEGRQTLDVQEDLRSQRYRFFKISMFHLISSYNILELGEFRFFGTRYETVNKLTSVSMSSDQALKNRVVSGNTIKVTFQSSEPINNVSATIQGEPATITTTDNLSWTASVVVKPTTPAGTVKLLMNYNTADGTPAEPVLFTTDSTTLFIADQKDFIANLLDITTLTDSAGRNATDVLKNANLLFDSSLTTLTDLRLNGSGNNSWLEFDFRGGGTVVLSRVDVIGRQDNNAGRINGTRVEGSNDNSSWTTISTSAVNSSDWQTLAITDTTPYRYIRMTNPNAWFGNMTELRLYGVAASTNRIASASISSTQALRNRIVAGDTVKLSFTAREAISNVKATIAGVNAALSTTDNITYVAAATVPQGTQPGAVKFAINYVTQDGRSGYEVTETTDGSSLNLVDESDTIQNVPTIATLIDSTTNRTAATTLTVVKTLFDANIATSSDFRNGSSGSGTGAWVVFDFKAGNQVNLTNTEVLARQDLFGRVNGLVFQGSNDNTTWTTLTPAAKSTADWQALPVASLTPYRYIRIYNPNAWYGSISEVRLHGSLHGADTIAPTTTATAPQGTVTTDATVTFTATDNQGGSGVSATYYTVDGGAQQKGNAATLTTSGMHTLSYWSADWAGNSEPPRTLTVSIDKSVDVTSLASIARSGLTVNRFTNKYTGTVTITNTSGQNLAGPLHFRLQALTAGVTLDTQTGVRDGVPYMALPVANLAPGQSVTLTTTFSNPNKVGIAYAPTLFSIK
ncbi:discoidin domain-containing protein [Pseudoduganella sp. UC29_106]|uniref:discoidin domain-containing protein n=1 Tax=Pseudoduganella sp. UC29_106 TaxID=3374553 RepID=UPI0037576E0C